MFYILQFLKNHNILRILIFISLIFSACKKFDNGVNFSLRSEEKRLVNTWGYVSVQNIITGDIQTSGFEGWTETLKKDGSYEKRIVYFGDELYTGNWEYDGETTLQLLYTVHQTEIIDVYEIKRLSNKELILKNDEKEIHLQKK